MTQTTQTSVMDRLSSRVAYWPDGDKQKANHYLVNDPDFNNNGTVYARTHDSLDAVGDRLDYTFQRGRVQFTRDGTPVAVWSADGGGTADFVCETLDALVNTVVALLMGRRN